MLGFNGDFSEGIVFVLDLKVQQMSENGKQLQLLQQQLLQTQQNLKLFQQQVRDCACVLALYAY